MRSLLRLTLILLVLAPGLLSAKIYKWIHPDGTTSYSDQPQVDGAKEVKLPALQVYSAPPTAPPAAIDAADVEAAASVAYEVVKITSPTSGESIRDNGGTVSVQLAIEPALQSGHVVEIVVDGKSIGSGTATSASVSNLDRGSHSISATIKDGAGKVIGNASAVTFQLHKASKLQPNRASKS